MNRPPIGLMPKKIWLEKRLEEVKGAITRYLDESLAVPGEWMDEYNELLKEIKVTKIIIKGDVE